MITSIMLKDTFNIGMDSYKRFMINDVKVSIKEVPFVRYRFDNYNDEKIAYIKEMKGIFTHSAHLAEINLDSDYIKNLDAINTISNMAKFIYISVNNDEVLNGFDENKMQLINRLNKSQIDRVMLKDNSTNLDTVAATRIKNQVASIVGINADDIGICSSPLSFDGTSACLTAVKARELAAKYTDGVDVALPSANHECMNCCGCIRYYLVEKDLPAPPQSNRGGKANTTKKESSKEPKQSKEKKVKKSNTKSIPQWII